MKVLKFGGTSMANADSIKKVAAIIKADKDNKFVIVSAPGKRESTDIKVTDLMYAAYDAKAKNGSCDTAFLAVQKRFDEIIAGLNLKLDLSKHYDTIKNDINNGASSDYAASRGEYLSAIVTAKYLGIEFIDAIELIAFDKDGKFLSEETNEKTANRLKKSKGAIIPGFYGITTDGKIKTFSRGGSDISGSIVARAVKASVYENWTDVDGFLVCDPRIVKNPAQIKTLTYKELRELSYMGANVLHSDSIFPVMKNGIPIHIRNSFNPQAEGTMIVPTGEDGKKKYPIALRTVTGIAGKKNFIAITIEKAMMNDEIGFAYKVLKVLNDHNISLAHMPSGIDTLTVLIDGCGINEEHSIERVKKDIESAVAPDKTEVLEHLALIAVVGHGMSRNPGTAAKICGALSDAGVNIRMIDQGSSELNVIVGVEEKDYERAIWALYDAVGK
ncbi:MAG: aspartate kinase [Firmicutes bacterium]|nr:aspartate kinase [Bacillota bacterium]